MTAPPGALRLVRWQGRHRILTDSVVALLLLAFAIGLQTQVAAQTASPAVSWPPVTIVALVACTAALCLRRTFPATVWGIIVAVPLAHHIIIRSTSHLAGWAIMRPTVLLTTYMVIGTPLCLLALALRYRAVWTWSAALSSALPCCALMSGPRGLAGPHFWIAFLILTLLNVIAALIGLIMRIQEIQLHEVRTRSARLVLAREQEAHLAAANERSRIAREMHDVVAHSLAVMITMADGAAATVDRNPAMAKEALGVLAETGRSALADTRRLVGVLRDDPGASSAPSAPASDPDITGRPEDGPGGPPGSSGPGAPPRAPGARTPEIRDLPVPEFAPPGTVAHVEPDEKIADLRRRATEEDADASRGDLPLAPAPEQADIAVLVSRFKAAGVPVTYSWTGKPLPEDKGLQLTVFRIAQEALTNVLRYAPTTRSVSVTVDRHVGTAVLTIDNEAAPGTTPVHGSGKGLIGMRERAAVYGGTVQAGPTADGWRVRAVLRWDEEDDERTSPWQLPL